MIPRLFDVAFDYYYLTTIKSQPALSPATRFDATPQPVTPRFDESHANSLVRPAAKIISEYFDSGLRHCLYAHDDEGRRRLTRTVEAESELIAEKVNSSRRR